MIKKLKVEEEVLKQTNRSFFDKLIRFYSFDDQKEKLQIKLNAKSIDLLKFSWYLYYLDAAKEEKRTLDCFFYNAEFFKQNYDIINWLLQYFKGDTENFQLNLKQISSSNDYTVKNKFSENYDKVVLFSGGLDSLSYTIKCLENKEKILLCYTDHNSIITGSVTSLYRKLNEIFNTGVDLVKVQYYMQDVKRVIVNSRAAAYSLNGIALANTLNIPEVIIAENGAMATLPKFEIAISPTRTVSPVLISKIHDFSRKLVPVYLNNPFLSKTKADIVSLVIKYPELVIDSTSCSRISAIRYLGKFGKNIIGKQHCGMCIACFVRMVSFTLLNEMKYLDSFRKNPLLFKKKSDINTINIPVFIKGVYTIISFVKYCIKIIKKEEKDLDYIIRTTLKFHGHLENERIEAISSYLLQKKFANEILQGIKGFYENYNLNINDYLIGKLVQGYFDTI